VVGVGTRDRTAVKVDRRIVGQEAERLETKAYHGVVDWIERQSRLDRTPEQRKSPHHHHHHHHHHL